MPTGDEGGVADVVRANVLGRHAAEELVGLVGAPARAAGRHQRRVGDHVWRARRVALCRGLHVRENLHVPTYDAQGLVENHSLSWCLDDSL